jgi:isocitrate lyase
MGSTSPPPPPAAATGPATFPFHFDPPAHDNVELNVETEVEMRGQPQDRRVTIPNVRGQIPSLQASKVRTMLYEAQKDPSKIVVTCCSYDGLTSRLCEEAGFPLVFLSGYTVASSQGLPDSGYIAMEDMCHKIQEAARQVSVPIFADGDTGYGSPMNVKRTVEWYVRMLLETPAASDNKTWAALRRLVLLES